MSTVVDAPRSALPPLFPARQGDDLSTHGHRQLFGYAGVVLPPLLWLIARWRPTPPLEPGKLLSSLSAYYYTSALVVQAGILGAWAAFLFTYRGYDNKRRRDRIAAIIAGSAALLVALFPTRAPLDSLRPEWWKTWMDGIHWVAGGVQFVGFIVFALVLFPKSNVTHGKSLPTDKQRRNRFYRFCGWGMVVSLLWAAIAKRNNASIFWPETVAVELFALSWLAKGRALYTFGAAGSWTKHYVRHPRRLVNDARSAIRSL